MLNSWVKERQARRQAKQEALEQLAEQRAARQEAAAGGCAAPGAEEKRQRMAEVVKARQRAFKVRGVGSGVGGDGAMVVGTVGLLFACLAVQLAGS